MKISRAKNEKHIRRITVFLLYFLLCSLILVLVSCDEYVEQSTNQIADYSTEPELALSPSPVPHNTIAAGIFHSLVIIDGSLWAWGFNADGELGDGTNENRNRPVQVGTDTDWVSVAVGMSHTVALKADGSLWAWGNNFHGQLGDGTTENRFSPVQIGTDTDWANIVAGSDYTVAIKTDGTLWAWGHNAHGQFGCEIVSEFMDGSKVLEPAPIGTYEVWTQMTTPSMCDTNFLIKEDGSLWAWGNNSHGQLGDGTTTSRDTPVQIGTDTDWVNVVLGDTRAVAVKTDGSVWSWGWAGFCSCDEEDYDGISWIGDGTHGEDRHTPVKILEGFGL